MKRQLQSFLKHRATSRRGFTLVELMVVIGIVALLIAVSSTAFFGGTRQDSVTKSRDQLRDLFYLARQEACISDKTQVLVCWNAQKEVKIGNNTEKIPQGRYALFEYIGNVWKSGTELYVPFRMQIDAMHSLKVGTRLLSLADPDASKFARITEVVYDSSKSQDDIQEKESNLGFKYMVGGQEGATNWSPTMTKIATFSGPLATKDNNRVPLAVRVSTVYYLPQYYQFDSDRKVFIFNADGCLATGSASSITAKPPTQAANQKESTFTVSVSGNGIVDVQ